jgi:hypothetical protein
MRLLLLTILFAFNIAYVRAQLDEPVYHPIDKSDWQKTVDGLNYNEKPEKQTEIPDPTLPDAPIASGLTIFKILGFLLIAGVLIFLLVYLFGSGLFSKNKVPDTFINTITELDERPMESDLERYLREALERRDFRLAIRIYYLMILKSLNDAEIITWKKEKTNMDYMRELRQHPNYDAFSSNTYIFEYVWYGEKVIHEPQFNSLSKPFIQLLQQMKSQK